MARSNEFGHSPVQFPREHSVYSASRPASNATGDDDDERTGYASPVATDVHLHSKVPLVGGTRKSVQTGFSVLYSLPRTRAARPPAGRSRSVKVTVRRVVLTRRSCEQVRGGNVWREVKGKIYGARSLRGSFVDGILCTGWTRAFAPGFLRVYVFVCG